MGCRNCWVVELHGRQRKPLTGGQVVAECMQCSLQTAAWLSRAICAAICLSVLFICSIYPCICPSLHPSIWAIQSIHPVKPCIFLSIHPSKHPPIYPFIRRTSCWPFLHLSILFFLSIQFSICASICLFYLSLDYLSARLSTHSFCPSTFASCPGVYLYMCLFIRAVYFCFHPSTCPSTLSTHLSCLSCLPV